MWVTENVSRQIVFSAADVWRVARAVLGAEFPGFGIMVARREEPGRFAGGGLGAGVMLVVHDNDGYELDYGQRLLLEACNHDARDHGYKIPQGVTGHVCHRSLDAYVGQPLPDNDELAVFVLHTQTVRDREDAGMAMAQ